MDYETFVREVATRGKAALPDATRAVEGTLEVLGQRLPPDVRSDLADALPLELAESLYLRKRGETFDPEDFFHRVRGASELDHATVLVLAGQTMALLRTAIPKGVFARVRDTLGPEWHEILGDASRPGVSRR